MLSSPLYYLLLAVEIAAVGAIISFVPYTEIDWKAYMQEVEGYLLGPELDYTKLRGDTGPLVYPAGFTYIFSGLYFLTSQGTDVLLAQLVFGFVYIVTLATVFSLYGASRRVPVYVACCLVLSKRIHSLFVLRMFNDTVAMMLLYIAVALFARRRWLPASFLYSLAVSVKMNVFLFAPGVLVVLLKHLPFVRVVGYLGVMAIVQLVLGLPFLLAYPVEYVSKAFELSRVFTYKWTVNFRFLPEDVFLSKPLALALLGLTLASWGLLLWKWYRRCRDPATRLGLSRSEIISCLFEFNLVGIAFSRTMHYQFYSWFFIIGQGVAVFGQRK
eukprot:PhM_4_TR1317/c7_g1_i3/m.52825/K03845/ALG3; alpha-1,3-mannosyltransferase